MKKSAARIFTLTFRKAEHIVSKIYRVKHIVPKAYRVPKAPKNDVLNAEQTSFRAQKKPRPLAQGVGEGSQRLHEGVRSQTKPRAKYN